MTFKNITSSDIFLPTEDLILKSAPVWHGTSLGWKKSVEKLITKVNVVSDRFCGVKYETKSDSSVIAYTAYLPTSGQDEQFIEVLSLLSFDIIQNNTENSIIIIGTDSNVSKKSSKRRQDAMRVFLDSFHLSSIMKNENPTFHHNNGTSESQIDHIYIFVPEKSKVQIDFKEHLCLKNNPTNISSHDVIVGEINLPEPIEESETEDYSSSYTPFVVKKPIWNTSGMEGYQIQTDRVLLELTNSFDKLEFIPILCEMFANALVMSAEKNFDTISPKERKVGKKLPYFSSQYKEAHKRHKKTCEEWRKAGRPSDSTHPAKASVLQSRRGVQQIRRQEETSHAIKNHEYLMNTFENDINKVYSKLKQIRGEDIRNNEIHFIETLNGKYSGKNVLEGFRKNTEMMCNEDESSQSYDNEFYKMAVFDDMIIFDITENEDTQIPHMNLTRLKDILFKKLKLNKACDVFKLTVEHLRNVGDNSLLLILKLLNSIIDNVNFLSSPQLNTSIASVVYKAKGKPLFHHKSHRLVRVTPLFGRLIDEHMRPDLVSIVRPMQNTNQYGFTETVSYLMGALQRHEGEKYCVDMKKTFFGCSLDGDSAFEVVNRTIQTRELYCAGEAGQYWQASHYSYKNSLTRIKMNGMLSRSIEESLGVKQGRNKSSDHYKVYIAPLLDTLDTSNLGVWIGNINVGVSGVADDVYLMSDKQTKLQSQMDIASHYGKMYRIKYGASKTKVTVIGSEIDIQYFEDVKPWKMDDKTVQVVENNEHLGQIVSGRKQEEKNVDLKVEKGRKSLYSLLGSSFSFKCLLSPVLKLHIYRTYTCPRTRSGLASFSLTSNQLEPLAIFQRKTLKSILKLSVTAPTPSVHFLTGELPIEGKIHRDIFFPSSMVSGRILTQKYIRL